MTPIERLNSLTDSFPQRDRLLIESLIDSRKFEELLELINSDIYLVRKDKYPEANITDMNIFKSELLAYMDQLYLIDDDEFDDNEDIIDTYEEY